jgi:hypothetical protein
VGVLGKLKGSRSVISASPVATAIAERKNRRSKRIERHRLLDQNRKAVDASPEVDRLTVQINLQVTAQSEHGPVLR